VSGGGFAEEAQLIMANAAAVPANAFRKLVADTHDFSELYILLTIELVPLKSASISVNLYESFLKTLCARAKKACLMSFLKSSMDLIPKIYSLFYYLLIDRVAARLRLVVCK
jgi:hypothetical protein